MIRLNKFDRFLAPMKRIDRKVGCNLLLCSACHAASYMAGKTVRLVMCSAILFVLIVLYCCLRGQFFLILLLCFLVQNDWGRRFYELPCLFFQCQDPLFPRILYLKDEWHCLIPTPPSLHLRLDSSVGISAGSGRGSFVT